jgi:AAA+ superfamily predicted ATPase
MEVDPEFTKYLEYLKALPEAEKKKHRDSILAEAGIKPLEDNKSDQPCDDSRNKEALEAGTRDRMPVSLTYNPETCWHPPTEPCGICTICGECREFWRDETYEVCTECCDKACWCCGITEDLKFGLCGLCSLRYDLDGICADCHRGNVELNETGVCPDCSAGVKSSTPVATTEGADDQERWWRVSRKGGITSTTSKTAPERTKTSSAAPNRRGLAKVAGMRELKALLKKDVVQAFRNPDLFSRYGLSIPHGILLFGPPGCGKTYIARQLAEELGCAFIESRQSDFASIYIHGSAIQIRKLFDTAEKSSPSVLFIDEFEGMVPSRAGLGSHQQHKSEEVNEFLSQLNECGRKKILVIAATNEPEKIDTAILRTGRMDKLIYVSPPDAAARVELLRFHLSNRPTDSGLDFWGLATILDGYSASDIRFLVDEAARKALDRKTELSTELIIEALRGVPPSISEDVQERFRSFGSRGN